ncbi:MAG: hypothetical protein Q9182_004713 [Xanthomendoza sp. 2 TL-2023]
MSFGYNAHFASSGRENVLNIADFAKDLLFGMKYGLNEESEELAIGKVPIIFVAHSMGGLVVKKAFILGQNDNQYKETITSARAILFLSTPHRGTNLAELLNRILAVSVFNHSAKQYVAELRQNSPALQDINEQFRQIAPQLTIFSFYETQQTAVGPRKMMVLEKDSSILGYPNEISKPLEADHHNVCKYTSPQDPNYVSVRNALKSLLRKLTTALPRQPSSAPAIDKLGIGVAMRNVENLLAVSAAPDDDYDFFRGRWMPGSCEWILSRPEFLSWLHNETTSRILWVHGIPGCGKSVLSSFVISQLQGMGYNCQYYFFRFGDHTKRTVNALLRSLAYQTAVQLPELRSLLDQMSGETVKLDKAEGRTIWQKVFVSRLFKVRLQQPLYWVIDALDECEAPQLLLSLFSSILSSQIPIRIMLVGRKTQILSSAFQRMDSSILINQLAVDNAKEDLELYVASEVEYMRGDSRLKARTKRTVCEKAHGNFLWVHLVLKEILQCHTEAAIGQALEELPTDLEPLYQRMESALSKTERPGDRELSRLILTWTICAQRALALEELSEALKPDFTSVLDLRVTIGQVCGDFVVVDGRGRVGMVHQTAREYLIKTPGLHHSITPRDGHQELLLRCISHLTNPSRKSRGENTLTLSARPFLHYAATSWSYHLGLSAASPDHTILLALDHFFESNYVLEWIYLMATWNHLKTLVYASQSLSSYLGRKTRVDAESSPLTHRLQEKETLDLWAVDLVKIVGKFGTQLVKHPRTIFSLVPILCPTTTAVFRHVGKKMAVVSVTLDGFARSKWDDCLSKFSIGRDTQSLRITTIESHFAILTSDGTLRLYDSITHQPVRKVVHGERVLSYKFSPSYEKCVTYGFRTTKVWSMKDSRQIASVANPITAKALDVSFGNNESSVISCSDDRAIRRLALDAEETVWETLDCDMDFDDAEGRQLNSPRRVAINMHGTQVALAFRGLPLFVWDINSGDFIGRCERDSDRNRSGRDLYSEVGPVCWNPVTGHVLGLYKDGCIFKWYPWESESQELRTVAAGIQCSPDGTLFVTNNTNGLLQVWNFHHFALVYQLSYHIPITDLALSADGRRVYDLRESFCNIWEPNALIRLAEADEKSSETTSTTGGSTLLSLPSETSNDILEPLTALAVGDRVWSYCSGDDAGVLRLKRMTDQKSIQVVQGFMPIDQIALSDDGKYLVTADLGGCLNVSMIDNSGPCPRCTRLFETKTGSGLQQLLISADAEHLLLVTVTFTELWSLISKTMVTTRPNSSPSSRWINHPSNSAYIIQCTFDDFRTYQWSTLDQMGCHHLAKSQQPSAEQQSPRGEGWQRPSASFPMSPDEKTDAVESAFISQDCCYLLLQTSWPSGERHRTVQYLMTRIEDLSISDSHNNSDVEAREIPLAVAARIEKVLGFASKKPRRRSHGLTGEPESEVEEVLTFLDKHDWICTWGVRSDFAANTDIRRHFFVPQDWLNLDSVRLATISRDGKFFCPRNGEVAVVGNWLQNEWVD